MARPTRIMGGGNVIGLNEDVQAVLLRGLDGRRRLLGTGAGGRGRLLKLVEREEGHDVLAGKRETGGGSWMGGGGMCNHENSSVQQSSSRPPLHAVRS